MDGSVASSGDCLTQETACRKIQQAADLITPDAGDIVKIRGTEDDGATQIIYPDIVEIKSPNNVNGAIFTNWDGDTCSTCENPAIVAELAGEIDHWVTSTPTLIGGFDTARNAHTAVWTGDTGSPTSTDAMIVWGGRGRFATYAGSTSLFGGLTKTGFIYNPQDDNWIETAVSTAPSARAKHTAVWTGNTGDDDTKYRMIVYGGYGMFWTGTEYYAWVIGGGGIYNPADNSWQVGIPNLGARAFHTAVWTGNTGYTDTENRMIVWGGCTFNGDPFIGKSPTIESYLNSGGIFNPAGGGQATNTTDSDTPTVRRSHTAVWAPELGNGGQMIIWGGANGDYTSGGRYFSYVLNNGSIWTPNGGGNPGGALNPDGATCNNSAGCWTTLSAPPVGLVARSNHTAIWTGSEMIIWGGFAENAAHLNDGAIWKPYNGSSCTYVGGCWANLVSAPISGRSEHTAIWTGNVMIVWGGCTSGYRGGLMGFGSLNTSEFESCYDGTLTNTGGVYSPSNNTWTSTTPSGVPVARFSHTAVLGESPGCLTKMIIFGGCAQSTSAACNADSVVLGNGKIYLTEGPSSPAFHIHNTGTDISNITIKDLEIRDCCGSGIAIEASGYTINGITIENNLISSNPGAGIIFKADNIEYNKIKNNSIQNAKDYGIFFEATAGVGNISNNSFDRNSISDVTGPGINLSAFQSIQYNSFSQNTLSSSLNAQGLNLQASDTISLNLIDSNIIQNNQSHGIYFHPQSDTLTISSNYIINNQINNNQADGIYLQADSSSNSSVGVLTGNVVLQNEIKQNAGDGLKLSVLTSTVSNNHINNNFIQDNIISGNANGLYINNLSLSGYVTSTRIFSNTIDSNTADGIYLNSPSYGVNSLRNNIVSNSSSYGIESTIPLNSNFNFFYENTTSTSGFIEESDSIGHSGSSICDNVDVLLPFSPTLPYLQSYSPENVLCTPLGNGAGSGDDKILGYNPNEVPSDDEKVLTSPDSSIGIVNMGARKELIINQKSTREDEADDFISNSIQQSHEDIHLGGADILDVYSIQEISHSLVSSGTVSDSQTPGIIYINAKDGALSQDDQYIGSYVLMTSGQNIGKAYPIVDTNADTWPPLDFYDFFYILTESTDGFSFDDTFTVLDRIYTESFNQPTSQFSLSKKGNPGWPITWQSKTWDKSLATPDWGDPPVNVLDSKNSLEYNLFAEDSVKCLAFKDFNFLNATSSPFGGKSPTSESLLTCIGTSPNLSCSEVFWSCIPYTFLELNSKTYDTGVHGGVAYNSILWFGSSPPGLPEYDSNSHAKYLKMQLAASDCPNGYSGSKGEADYDQKCQDMTQDYWGKPYDPGNNQYGSPFYGDDTEEGINCIEFSYYYPDPDTILPIKGECFNNLYNKRYFKYKLILNYFDKSKDGYPSEGDTTARVDEIIVNYSR